MPGTRPLPAADVLRARTAVVVAFATNGVAFASFVSRAPALRDTLDLSSAGLGLLLLCLSAGAVTGLPLSGPLVHRVGAGRAALGGALVAAAGLALLATGLVAAAVPAAGIGMFAAGIGLFAAGLGMGVWDVAMNVEGADVERRLGRSLMPRLHAAFSLGSVAGAGLGAATAATGVPLAAQAVTVGALLPIVMVPVVGGFGGARGDERASGVGAAWREPRTLLIGLLVLAFAFAEGAANDWIAIAFVDGYGAGEAVGAVAFGLFVAAMTAGRLLGGAVLDRFGRVAVLRAAAVLALVGLLLVLSGGAMPFALAGALLWGTGTALGFPVGMSAAADDPRRAAARVCVVSSIGYTAFLAGPPLIGLLAESVGILRALPVVLGALALGLLAAPASRACAPRPAVASTRP